MSGNSKSVLIIGYGEMGHAMECLLADRHRLSFWDIRTPGEHPAVVLEAAVGTADFVIYCVPVTPLGELAARVMPALPEHCISLSVAKGLDARGRPAARILTDVYGSTRGFGVLYGPMIAEEIRAGRHAFAQAGMSRPDDFSAVTALFAGSTLITKFAADITGISWASVLKNVYALLFGAADELGLGDNVRGHLVVAALGEMQSIITDRGGRADSALALAGLGDLVTTATSAGSHHRALGHRLAQGECGRLTGEGLHTLAMAREYGLIDMHAHPLFRLAQALVDTPTEARKLFQDYLAALNPR